MSVRAVIALGSNVGDRAAHLRAALEMIAGIEGVAIIACSSFHETAPVGPPGQGEYLNAAAVVDTSRSPRDLLGELLAIERARGRERAKEQRWGARTLDLDLLLMGETVLDEPGLTLPHPRLHERLFVLAPLAEVWPEARHPVLNRTAAELLAALRLSIQ